MSTTVSIIVPVYKAENLLSRCVNSILNQTFSDWELILVDDGSPDTSGVICENFAREDKRIKVIHKDNEGVSSARNYGLNVATADYITFIDADDYICPSFLQTMIKNNPADLIICGFVNVGGETFCPDRCSINTQLDSKLITNLIEVPFFLDAPWCKFFRRELIIKNHLSFDTNLRLSEDTLFCYKYLSYCSTIEITPEPLYVYDGVWGGGGNKYTLSYDELKYASKQLIDSLSVVGNTFQVNINTRYKCFHLSKLNGLFSDFTDREIYNLYIDSHDCISFDEYMGDGLLSPLTIGSLMAQRLVKEGHIDECKNHLSNLREFITSPIKHYPNKKQKIFYLSLFHLGINSTIRLLSLVSYFK